jgi:DNA-binding MarR family transcriptional regulator
MTDERTNAIVRAVLALGRRLRAERPAKSAKLPAISILSTLYRGGPMTASGLAAEERLQPQSLTRLIGELDANGWIARTRSTEDRREIQIALTGRGRRVLVSDMQARRIWLESAMAAALTQSERAALLQASGAMLKLARFEGKKATLVR